MCANFFLCFSFSVHGTYLSLFIFQKAEKGRASMMESRLCPRAESLERSKLGANEFRMSRTLPKFFFFPCTISLLFPMSPLHCTQIKCEGRVCSPQCHIYHSTCCSFTTVGVFWLHNIH
uniref:Putative secreted protein n=1 Tax=Amblyomma cajennense TaxID=34607 RepID=A0A023FDY5_AMBCJ